ncbi:hypothetical protein NQ176_g1352 [Zarea fungicola]|uniref:Uncharacterized protein n=1 Tax=Zarea fungicola TaxID=93591 RepID=A0ACC1NTP8_9HYPO|nr:hypothetical protein NQ176_g1352 [Lecanicillium fungicola]
MSRKSKLEGFGMLRVELDASGKEGVAKAADGEMPHVSEQEIEKLSGFEVALPESPPARNSPVLQRILVADCRYSLQMSILAWRAWKAETKP